MSNNMLEVFFDYSCPYCLQGHVYLLEVLKSHPDIEVVWKPCEAHPRPEVYGSHSDLCARGMYIANEKGADLMKYHEIMYAAALTEKCDIESIDVLSQRVKDILDPAEFSVALSGSSYKDQLDENNRLAWGEYDFSAVPSMRRNGELLISLGGIGLTKQMIEDFLSK